jgi:hypothetical protein
MTGWCLWKLFLVFINWAYIEPELMFCQTPNIFPDAYYYNGTT